MQALIFNSGTGTRMGDLTKNKPKCLLEIADGVTILDLQIKRLISCGIRSFVITTGKHDKMIRDAVAAGRYNADFVFVNNPVYSNTNYIYSMHLSRDYLDFSKSVITLHGDMVFDENVLRGLISSDYQNAVIVNGGVYLSEKDFNAATDNGIVIRINVGVQGATNFLLPVYKLCGNGLRIWFDTVAEFVAEGKTGVYAEDAFNTVSDKIGLKPFYIDIENDFCMEVDNIGDLRICINKVRI